MRVQPLHGAAAGRHIEVCRLLIASGADVNATQQHDFTPLHAAAQHGDNELVELFLSAGADPPGDGPMAATRPRTSPRPPATSTSRRRLREVAEDRAAG